MLDPDHVVALFTCLFIQDTLERCHVLAGHILIHNDDLNIPGLALAPQLIDHIVVPAVGVTAHDHALVQTGQILESKLFVFRLQRLGEVEGFHLDEDIHAPAVCKPVAEVGIVVGRAGPYDSAVFHLAAPRLFPALVGLHHNVIDFAEGLHHAGIHTAVHLIVPLAEQLVARAENLRIRRFVDFPLFQLVLRLFIEALHGGEVCIPVPLCAGRLFHEPDTGLDVFRGIFNGFLIFITDREGQMEDRQIREPA